MIKTLDNTGVLSKKVLKTAVNGWFSNKNWQIFDFQKNVWDAYQRGESGLIHAATGAGKTLAAWLAPVLAIDQPLPLTVLWITPMRALAQDTRLSLETPIRDLNLSWTIGVRTGDTTSGERAKQNKEMPSALITTPESLSLMLTQKNAREQLANVECVVIDEWHEMIGNKRGVQVELALARLRQWCPQMRTWGLSATLGNLDEAMAVLMGARAGVGAHGVMIEGIKNKKMVIDTLLPRVSPSAERSTQQRDQQSTPPDLLSGLVTAVPDSAPAKFPWAGHLGLTMLADVAHEIEATAKSGGATLVFTNTRSQSEIWYQALLAAKPEWAGIIALHHGSLSRDVRGYVEAGLKSGALIAVVATSSLDLGVDFSPVARVLQIGSPKGVARLLQRAGRSGHAPGQVSRVTLVPTHAFEFIESLAAQRAATQKKIESRTPIICPLDVLIQHMVTVALGVGFVADELLAEVRTTHAFRDLRDDEFDWALDFVTRGGEALHAYPEYRKVELVGERYVVNKKEIAKNHRLAIGTIVSDASMEVRYLNGTRLGHVEESFVARLSPGDAFTFAGRTLELIRVRDMAAYVKPAKKVKNLVPHWAGGRMPLSTQLADSVREVLTDIRRQDSSTLASPEFKQVASLFRVQRSMSVIPRNDELLIEQILTREGNHLFFYPYAGRQAHTGMAALISYRLGQVTPATFSFSVNDYGFELLSATPFTLNKPLLDAVFSTDNLWMDLLKSLNAAELSKRHFREIARVAGLIFVGYPGANKTNKQLQATSGLIYDVFAQWDKQNPLLAQATCEVMARECEFQRLSNALNEIKTKRITIVRGERPTPFSFPLMVERLREKLTTEKLSDRIARMQAIFETIT